MRTACRGSSTGAWGSLGWGGDQGGRQALLGPNPHFSGVVQVSRRRGIHCSHLHQGPDLGLLCWGDVTEGHNGGRDGAWRALPSGGVGGSSRSWPGHMYEGAGVGQFGASVSYPRGPPTPGQAAVCVALRLCLRGSGSPEDAMLGQPGDTEHAPPWPTCPAPAGNTGLSQDAEGSLAQGGSLCWGLVSLSDPHLRREVAGMASLPGGVCTQAAPEQQASRCSPGGGRSRRWAGPRAGGPFPH